MTHDQVLEVTRIACDGTTQGAASKLMRDLTHWAKARAQGNPWLVITHSLAQERGGLYRALRDIGQRPAMLCKGQGGGGSRGHGVLAKQDKIR